MMEELESQFPKEEFYFSLTGSGAKPIAEALKIPFVQEVAANAEALKSRYRRVGSAIELGGQDAKMIFFRDGQRRRAAGGGYAHERQLRRRDGSLHR